MNKSNRYFAILMLSVVGIMALSGKAQAEADGKNGVETYQTYPGTSTRDFSAPTYTTTRSGNTAVTTQSYPGSSTRDFTAPSRVSETNRDGTVTTYQTYPGSSTRDFTAPTYTTKRK